MEPLGLKIMLLFLLIANILGLITVQLDKQDLQRNHARLTESVIWGIHVIQIANILVVVGVWLFHSWAVWLGLALAFIVILLDVYVKLWYHISVVVVTTSIIGYLIYLDWELFT